MSRWRPSLLYPHHFISVFRPPPAFIKDGTRIVLHFTLSVSPGSIHGAVLFVNSYSRLHSVLHWLQHETGQLSLHRQRWQRTASLHHTQPTDRCWALSVHLFSVCLSDIYLSIYIYLSVSKSVCLYLFFHLSIYLFCYFSVYLCVCLSILSIYLAICISLFVCLSVCLSVSLSMYFSVFLVWHLSMYLFRYFSIFFSCLSICLSI